MAQVVVHERIQHRRGAVCRHPRAAAAGRDRARAGEGIPRSASSCGGEGRNTTGGKMNDMNDTNDEHKHEDDEQIVIMFFDMIEK